MQSNAATPAVEACSAVGGAERVVHVRHRPASASILAERRVVLLLALVEAQVLHHQQRRRRAGAAALRLRVSAHGVRGERDRGLAQQLAQALRRPGASVNCPFEALARRTAQVAHEHDARAARDELFGWSAAPRGCACRRSPRRPSTGTLKSTRTSTRLPAASTPVDGS